MKSFCILLAVYFFISIQSYSQTDKVVRYYADRYALDIPEEWKKPKLIEAITEILPKTFNEYIDSNKQFCVDCKADFAIMLMIDEPFFEPGKETYQFRAALVLFDSSGKELIELLLVSPQEIFNNKTTATILRSPQGLNYTDVTRQVIRDGSGNIINVTTLPYKPKALNNVPVFHHIRPSLIDVMIIAENKIYEIRKILQKVNTN